MYSALRIQNFRCFADLTWGNLARINLITGKNNVGKTSLLEAVLLYSGEYNALISRTYPEFVNFAPNSLSIRQFTDWRHLFHNFNVDNHPTFHGTGNFDSKREERPIEKTGYLEIEAVNLSQGNISVSEWQNLESWTKSINTRLAGVLGIRRDDDPKLTYFSYDTNGNAYLTTPRTLTSSHYPSKYEFIPARTHYPATIDTLRLAELRRTMQLDFVKDALQYLEPRLLDLETLPDGIYARLRGIEQLISLSAMGDGLVRLNSLLLAMNSVANGILLIDEIENGFHYSVMESVLKTIGYAAEKFKVQVFATTHSFELIEAAHKAFSETDNYPFAVHRLERTGQGRIQMIDYDRETLDVTIEANLEVR